MANPDHAEQSRGSDGRFVKGAPSANPSGINQWSHVRAEAQRMLDVVARSIPTRKELETWNREEREEGTIPLNRLELLLLRLWDDAIGGDNDAARLLLNRILPTLASVELPPASPQGSTDARAELARRLDQLGLRSPREVVDVTPE